MLSAGSMRAFLVFLVAIVFVAIWVNWPLPAADDRQPIEFAEFGDTATGATMLLVEPLLAPRDYQSAETLYAALSDYLEAAQHSGWRGDRSVVVFPEYVGAWLIAAHAPSLAYRAKTLSLATLALVADEPLSFVRAYSQSREEEKISAAVFRARSAVSAKSYVAVFSRLAGEYGVTIVAGSTILTNPKIEDGQLLTSTGDLYNVSAVFDPAGSLIAPLAFKRHLIPSERGFAAGGETSMPVFDTPAGRLGVLICADAWHPELYEELRLENVELVATPAFLAEKESWDSAWRGYVTPTPVDAQNVQISAYTEGEAWEQFSLPGRIGLSGATGGGVAFLRSDLWDLGSDGRTLAVSGDRRFLGEKKNTGSVTLIRF